MWRKLQQKLQDDNVEKEIITIYDLKIRQELDNKNKNLSEIPYHKIEDKKREELEKVFKQIKTNIKLSFNLEKSFKRGKETIIPEILYDIKKEKNNNICTIYNGKYLSKIIKIEISGFILFVEKLDNKDLIFLILNGKDYELLIYRLMQEQNNESKGYFLFQKIKETLEGYEIKYNIKKIRYFYEYKEKDIPIEYNLFYIKAISRNRFFCVSNYGFKMYSLNEKKEYELVLLESYKKIDFIYEIDAYKFIFGSNIRTVEGYGFCGNAYTCYYNLSLDKIELKDIDNLDKNSKQDNDSNNLKVKEKLKFSFISQTMYKINFSSPLIYDIKVDFSDFVCLKNKFFLIMIKNRILVFNMEEGKEIKKFEINIDNIGYLEIDIKKWDCPENDEFILIVDNNVILFRLKEENSSKISLNILNYGYFPGLCINERTAYKNLKKINSQKNIFYSYNNKSNDIIIYYN